MDHRNNTKDSVVLVTARDGKQLSGFFFFIIGRAIPDFKYNSNLYDILSHQGSGQANVIAI